MIEQKPVVELSHSSVKKIDHCPRKYQIDKMFMHPADTQWEGSLAATSGTAIHNYYQALLAGKTLEEAAMAFYLAWDFEIEDRDTDANRRYRDFYASYHTAKYFAETVPPAPESIAKVQRNGELVPAVEVKFNIILRSERWSNDYHYRGAIDWVTYNANNNRFKTVDCKTHRNNTKNNDYRYRWDIQTVPYGLVIAHLTGGDVADFDTEYCSIYTDIAAPRVEQLPFHKTREDVMNWFQQVQLRIQQIEQYYNSPVWPRSISGCDVYNKPCRHYKYCEVADPVMLQNAILGFSEPKEPEPFGEWLVMEINL